MTDERILGLALKILNTDVAYRKVNIPESPTNPCFAQVIYWEKHFSLVKYIKKTFVPADFVDKGLAVVGRKYGSYDKQETYYVGNSDNKMSKIKLSKGDILKVTAAISREKRDEILQYCKDNDISNPLSEEDAVLMLAFIDKL